MKFSLSSIFLVALAADSALGSTWFGKTAYNKWHQTELERWLSDHDVPYPTPADRKDLESLIKKNWDQKVVHPYNDWEPTQLQDYLTWKGIQTKDQATAKAKVNKDSLISQVKANWYDTEASANEAYASVKNWILDSWTDSQLKAFADKNGIPVPQPRKRDSLLAAVRDNYESAAEKTRETVNYPGNWLYAAWTESDLKEWLDERGIPAPQPSSRDKLIAKVRRNSRLASLRAKSTTASASASAASASSSLVDKLLDSWTDSQIKEWADKNGIKVPQGSKTNELRALARKNSAALLGDTAASTASAQFGAATSKAANTAQKIGEDAQAKAEDAFNTAFNSWSDSRLKAYLDSRGVPVPQNGKTDELKALVRKNQHKASTGYSAWTFDTWTAENLRKYLKASKDKAANKAAANAKATRQELVKQAQDNYAQASKSGGVAYASVTSYLAQATDNAKDASFDSWTDSDLKAYLDSYGVPTYQGTKSEELKAMARRNYNYFRYGTSTPSGTIFARIQEGVQWAFDQLKIGAASGTEQAKKQGQKGYDAATEAATTASNRAQEAAQRATDRAKEEL